jgi:hypothetical protein
MQLLKISLLVAAFAGFAVAKPAEGTTTVEPGRLSPIRITSSKRKSYSNTAEAPTKTDEAVGARDKKYDRQYDRKYDRNYDRQYNRDYNRDYNKNYNREYNRGYDKKYNREYNKKYNNDYDKSYNRDYNKNYNRDYDKNYNQGYDRSYNQDYNGRYSLTFAPDTATAPAAPDATPTL